LTVRPWEAQMVHNRTRGMRLPDALAQQIEALPKMNRAQLQAKWREILRQPAPAHLRKQLLVPLLAYKLQEQAYGGLKPEVKRRLRELARQLEARPGKEVSSTLLRLKPGTQLLRSWQGETHAVTVGEEGFGYKGEQFKSLSEIARRITGTRWSGPLFFGLKQGQTRKEANER
jgi:Protein of unknown function (DUF2924)